MRNLVTRFKRYIGIHGYRSYLDDRFEDYPLYRKIRFLTLPYKLYRVLIVLRGIYFDRLFDKKYKVETCSPAFLWDLDINSESVADGVMYDPFPIHSFRFLIRALPIQDFSDYSFIDFGSGRGRILLGASEYNFNRITGVEFSQELHDSAVANLKSYQNKHQKCFDVESICEDAVTFSLPNSNNVYFFFAPFQGKILKQVLHNLKNSYLKHPRPMYIIYTADIKFYEIPWDEIEQLNLFEKLSSGTLPFDLAQRYPNQYAIFGLKSSVD